MRGDRVVIQHHVGGIHELLAVLDVPGVPRERMQVQWNGEVVLLSLTEFWIVHALARHPGHVKNRQQLMDAANVVLDDNTITSHVKRIRRKFQALDPRFDAVQTVYGMGYRWVE